MKHLLCALLALVVAAHAASELEGTSESPMGQWEEVTSFIESNADAEVDRPRPGFPIPLSKKQQKTTIEAKYLGEDKKKPVVYITPQYMAPKKAADKKKKEKHPTTFTTHYFSPLPKVKTVKPQASIPLSSPQTPTQLAMAKKGWIQAGVDPRAPYPMEKKDNKQNPVSPAPIVKLLEVSADETQTEEAPASPPFSQQEIPHGMMTPTVVASAEEFFSHSDEFLTPGYTDEQEVETEHVVEAVEQLPELVETETQTSAEEEEETSRFAQIMVDEAEIEAEEQQLDEEEEADEAEEFEEGFEEEEEEESSEEEEEESFEESEEDEAADADEAEEVDTLLMEVDAHLSPKGTPGQAVPAGLSWEEAQMQRIEALHQQMKEAHEKAPKFAARVLGVGEIHNAAEGSVNAEIQHEETESVEYTTPEMN